MRIETNTAQTPKGFAYIWFAYTAFLFIAPIMEPSWHNWLLALGALALFFCIFVVYTRSCSNNSTARYWMIAATFVLGLVVFPFNPGATTFFVYTAAFLPFNIASTWRVLALFVAESFAIAAETYTLHVLHHANNAFWPNAIFAIFLLLVIGCGNIFFAQQKRGDSKLRMAHEEIEALAALAERERIARDLHDVLGHTLSVIVLKAELAGRLIGHDPQRAVSEIADVERTARTALAEVREAIGGYRARGLAAEIEAARRTLDVAGVTLILDSAAESVPSSAALTAAEETVLSLALREAVTNIVRHAKAKTCRLNFVTEQGRRRLLVEDDGEHALIREGNGLRGMRERVEALGGHVSLERERGTRLLIELPLRPTESAA
jgi:two-component system, NarL family, sensor histidine kinase DesK